MHRHGMPLLLVLSLTLGACSVSTQTTGTNVGLASAPHSAAVGTLARIYYWRALPGKLPEYGRYIRESAERVDAEAQRNGAFVAVTTYVSTDPASPWTHMRVFILRDSMQLAGLSAALAAAGNTFEPDSTKRRVRAEYVATLRERVGDATVEILR